MKVKKVLDSLRADPDERARLRYAAGDLGDEMFRHREWVIAEFRAGVSGIKAYSVAGKAYLAALADVAAAFHACLIREDDEAFLAAQAKKPKKKSDPAKIRNRPYRRAISR